MVNYSYFFLFIYFFLSYNNCSSCLKTTFPCVDQWFKLFYLYRPWIKTKCVVEILRNLNWLKSVSNRVKTNSSYPDLKILFFISLCELITWIIKGLWGSRMLPQNGTQKTSSLHREDASSLADTKGDIKWQSLHMKTALQNSREQFKTLLNLFYIPTTFANAISYYRREIMHGFGRKLGEY